MGADGMVKTARTLRADGVGSHEQGHSSGEVAGCAMPSAAAGGLVGDGWEGIWLAGGGCGLAVGRGDSGGAGKAAQLAPEPPHGTVLTWAASVLEMSVNAKNEQHEI